MSSSVGPSQVRRFYLTFGAVLSVVAVFSLWTGHRTRALILAVVASTLLTIHFLLPPAGRALFLIYTRLLGQAGILLTKIFMTLFFYVIFTPYGLLYRLTHGDALQRKPDPRLDSYWKKRRYDKAVDQECCNPF